MPGTYDAGVDCQPPLFSDNQFSNALCFKVPGAIKQVDVSAPCIGVDRLSVSDGKRLIDSLFEQPTNSAVTIRIIGMRFKGWPRYLTWS